MTATSAMSAMSESTHVGRDSGRSDAGITTPRIRIRTTSISLLGVGLAVCPLVIVSPPMATPAAAQTMTQSPLSPSPSLQPPPPGTVTLSLAEYNRLLDRGATASTIRQDPPVPAALSRAEIDLRVTGGAARASITLQGEVFRTGPTEVPLIAGGTLIAAQLAGKPVPLTYASGSYRAILPGIALPPSLRSLGTRPDSPVPDATLPGGAPFTLSLTWGAPVVTEPGRASVALPMVVASSVRTAIELPGDVGDVRLERGVITARRVVDGRTRLDVTLDAGAPARVSWSSRESAEPAVRREVRLLSDVKALVTIGEADERIAALFDVTVVQGDPARFDVRVPAGFELASVSGASVEEGARGEGVVALTIREPARRRHQFLIALERAISGAVPTTASATASVSASGTAGALGGSAAAPDDAAAGLAAGVLSRRSVSLPWLDGVPRESGEVAIEGVGTLELRAEESEGLRRLDASELSAALQSVARGSVLAAFRYQRRAPAAVALDLGVTRFPESAVLAAVADRAVVTTMMTREGRALTEMTLTVRNQGQPFVKVGLPERATVLSAEVSGVSVKPVVGPDGVRVPLLRAAFRPRGSYQVSFVYLQSGASYAKKGEAAIALARLDLPVSLLEWELFLPDGIQVKRFDGDLLPRELVASTLRSPGMDTNIRLGGGVVGGKVYGVPGGTVGGVVGGLPEAPPPPPPFSQARQEEDADRQGKVVEQITVAPAPTMAFASAVPIEAPAQQAQTAGEPSVNVQNLQRRIAGVLPVRIDVPRTGKSYLFVRPVVLDEDTTVRFTYRTRS